jgi:predicted enzyme related to lactoylglutathione lyase
MFAVPDVDAAADMVRQRGGKIVLAWISTRPNSPNTARD